MKYKVTRPFIAFGRTAEPGEIVHLNEEQAAALLEVDSIVRYEVKVDPVPETKKPKKSSASSQAGRAPAKKTRKKSKKSATK